MKTRQPICPGGIPYTIRPGDTFYSIARWYGVSLDDLIAANPGVDPDNLRVGQVICIPGVTPGKCPPGTRPYIIQRGDTFCSIAKRYGITVQDLIDANPGVDPNNLQIGQTICIPKKPQPVCPPGTFPYRVKAGDTFYSLAQRYNTTVEAIKAANPGVDPNNLQIGQTICIPEAGPQPVCPPETFPYRVRAGDTFYSLAQRYNTTVEAIRAANPGVDPNNLQIGQTICIPKKPQPVCPPGTFPYRVKAGDTFYSLAQRYNTTVEAIKAANPGVDPNNLQIGQTICIPEAGPQPVCPPETFPYRVRAGDTFYSLAQRYNTTVEAIRAANPGVDPNNLQIGQTICIPGTPGPGPCPSGTFPYRVRPGDTFYRLAIRYNTTVEAIQAANPGVDPNRLRIGQIICIPQS
ncbi:MAG: LysM peptidoglycan-binding domain-containing protein [Desulfotomaculum sp.]|nr:LysM peptidoglycan-binding domain-containing protein [Desulfotomaculum sp.]